MPKRATDTGGDLLLKALAAGPRKSLEGVVDLAALVGSLLDRGRAAWPTLELSDAAFIRYLAERLPAQGTEAALRAVRAEELFLACGCVGGDAQAIQRFRSGYFDGVDRALARIDIGTQAQQDVRQSLEVMLLVGEAGNPPALSKYSGAGDLGNWIRATAVRLALRSEGKRRSEDPIPEDHDTPQGNLAAADPELAFLKSTHAAQFEEAFREGFAALSPRERNLLKQHHHHGLSVEELGALFRVHKATAARWVAKARATLLENVRRGLLEKLRVGPTTLRSLSVALRSQLADQLTRLFSDESFK